MQDLQINKLLTGLQNIGIDRRAKNSYKYTKTSNKTKTKKSLNQKGT